MQLARKADWRRVTRTVDALDKEVFAAVARTDSPILDAVMPKVSRAADYSLLWMAIAAGMRLSRSRVTNRAAARGIGTLAVSSLVTNQLAKRVRARKRPGLEGVPLARLARRMPTSHSFPSGHSASAAAFAIGAGMESAPIGLGLAAIGGAVGFSRVATGAHYPSDVIGGFAIGAGLAIIGAKLIPPVRVPPPGRSEPLQVELPRRIDGAGLVIVANPASGSGRGGEVIEEIEQKLPKAEVIRLEKDDDVEDVLDKAAARGDVLGIAGGDGTVCAAAVAAMKHDVPLAVFPGGTFNHFAGDLGVNEVDDVVDAVSQGTATKVDVAYLNDKAFLNTASAGSYPEFVRIREKYEKRIGKPLAAALAGFRVMRSDPTSKVRYDGKEFEMQLLFIGNSLYEPRGFAPSLRTRLADGLLDVRILQGANRFSLFKVVLSLLTGQLSRNKRYHEIDAPEFELQILDGAVPLARDGELGEKADRLSLRVDYRALTVYRPPYAQI